MNRDEYWTREIELIQSIIEKTELQPTTKWGMKVYTLDGKNVVGAIGFKHHFCLWFYNGVFLSDPLKVLINAQEGKTKAMRQWRFQSGDEIQEHDILSYILEAIQNEKAGKVLVPEKTEEMEIPLILKAKLDEMPALKKAFDALSPYRQKEYSEHLVTAKREATQLSRLEKSIPMILAGKGLNDKYR